MRILNTKTLYLLKRIRQDFVQPETYFSCNFVCLRSLVIIWVVWKDVACMMNFKYTASWSRDNIYSFRCCFAQCQNGRRAVKETLGKVILKKTDVRRWGCIEKSRNTWRICVWAKTLPYDDALYREITFLTLGTKRVKLCWSKPRTQAVDSFTTAFWIDFCNFVNKWWLMTNAVVAFTSVGIT